MSRPTKLSEEQMNKIRELHFKDGVPYKDLAMKYEVHFNTILRICEPETYQRHLQKSREYQKINRVAINAQRKPKARRFIFTFDKQKDAAIIAHIDSKDNETQYIRDLVLKDMASTDASAAEENPASAN